MKTTKLSVTGILATFLLALACISSHAQYVTNFMAYNFDTGIGPWTGGGPIVSVQWDPTEDSSNNPASGSMKVEVNYQGGQYVLMDGLTPSYSPLPIVGLVAFTSLSWDMHYYSTNAGLIRTNAQGGPMDFGYARVGSRSTSYAQDWFYYYAVPATNSFGQPNTNWVHISADLSGVPSAFPDLASGGLVNIMFGQDDGAYGNNMLSGTQFLWFDNIQYIGWVAPLPPPIMSIQKASPGLQLFPGSGIYGRSQLQISTNYLNDGWIGAGTTYPVSYSFTVTDNATSPGGLDTHLTFLPAFQDSGPAPGGNAIADYSDFNCLWLQIISGSGSNTACVCNFSWKTNSPGTNPNAPVTNSLGQPQGGVVLWFTNSVRAGTWTVTWSNDITGSITCPGSNNITGTSPIPFDLTAPNPSLMPAGNSNAPALSSANADTNFSNPMYVRFGDMNYGNGTRPYPDQWNSISISGTAGTNFMVDFTKQGFNTSNAPAGLDPNLWDLTSSDGGAEETMQVPTNAQYWVKWNQPDNGFYLETSTNVNGPWRYPEYYNAYADGSNYFITTLPTQTTHSSTRWNLMLPVYLPTANGLTNPPGGNPLSPSAYFRLATNAPAL